MCTLPKASENKAHCILDEAMKVSIEGLKTLKMDKDLDTVLTFLDTKLKK